MTVTILAAFGAGLLSFLSPCVLPLVPGYHGADQDPALLKHEADRIGYQVMTEAGYSPQGMAAMFEKLENASRLNDSGNYPYLRSHPLTTQRIADMQQRQHQRGELVAQRNAREPHADVRALAPDQEAGLAFVVIVAAHLDLAVRDRDDLLQQGLQLDRLGPRAQRGDQFDGMDDVLEVGFELGFQIGV